jgi:hypothetical protein
MNTLDVTVTLEGSLLLNSTVTPPAGAGALSDTRYAVCCPTDTTVLAGKLIDAGGPLTVTVTDAVAFPNPVALAVIVAAPAPVADTGITALDAPAATLTDAGTLATAGLLDERLTVTPTARVAENDSVRFCEPAPESVIDPGEKLMVPPEPPDPPEFPAPPPT